MLEPFEQTLLSYLQIIFDRFGWLGVFGLMIFENATGITPAEIILAFSGWMLIERHGVPITFIPLAGFYAGLGSTIGASIPYWIARRGGRSLVERFAKFFHVHLLYIEKIEALCRRWGAWIVLVGRILPGVRPLISLPAGLVRIPFPQFFLATFIGSYVWSTALIGAGYVLGHEWLLIIDYIGKHLPFIFIAGFLLVSTYLVFRYRASLLFSGWMRRNDKEWDS
jgi:membrane protein DedA with SNARE-associated domain